MSSKISGEKTVGLLLIGGLHHILHLIPIASELYKIDGIRVVIFVRKEAEKAECARILDALNMPKADIEILKPNRVLKIVSPKLSALFGNLKRFKALEALIVVERTSTILRFVMRNMPTFIHIPHGAGDRAKSYDPRIRHFDHVLVAGEKDKRRMIDLGLVSEENCHVTGYIKPYAVRQIGKTLPELFEAKKPIVLYNPHFSKALSSWDEYGRDLLTLFAKSPDYNFIIAPHIRLFAEASASERAEIEAFAAHDNIHVDLGSERSTDMTYTQSADIYLGDVSSQVYEFLSRPKPCIFIGKPEVQWKDNPDYAHWNYGKVCHSIDDVAAALEQANDEHEAFIAAQVKGCHGAMGEPHWNPIARAAQSVEAILKA